MDRTTAINRLRKLLGPKAYIEINDKAPDADEREAMHERFKAAKADRDAAQQEMNERTAALQKTDPLYQAALTDWRNAGKVMQANANYHQRKFHVGTVSGGAGLTWAHVLATADRWEDIFAKLAELGVGKKKG